MDRIEGSRIRSEAVFDRRCDEVLLLWGRCERQRMEGKSILGNERQPHKRESRVW